MKKQLLLLGILLPFFAFSQVPSYYNDVNLNLSGQSLQEELAVKIINTHTTFLSYTPGVWDALKLSDLDPSNPSKVLLIYGWDDNDGSSSNDRSRGINDNGGGSTDWNREHVYARSLGNPNLGTSGPGADAHHLRPSDVGWNSMRGNKKFADGSGNSGTVGSNWYPGDEWKGDVARMMMYMYLRYGNQCLPTDVGVGSTIATDPNMINLFLEWNVEDPVSNFELQRNPALEGIQGNRNPFIDNPAFATQIWGGAQAEDRFGGTGTADTVAPSVPTNLISSNITETTVNLNWTASIDNIGVTGYNVYENEVLSFVTVSTSQNVTGLSSATTYSFTVRAKDAAGNLSNASTAVVVTTNTSGGGSGNGTATELLISEYVEGSSNNKALEIANFTGSAVNLSTYSLKRNTNGGSSWGSAFSLSGSLANGEVFVVANTNASSSVTSLANTTTSSAAITFNGNDPVGLFKNDVLIDIIGVFNGGSANFAKDVTLRRKADVSSPVTSYNTNEWDSFSIDTFDDLGSHTLSGGGSTTDTTAPSEPTNLSSSNITETSVNLSWTASSDNVGVAGYDIFQNGTFIASTSNTNLSVSGLNNDTTYSFTVKANDTAGNESNLSAVLSVTTLATQQNPTTILHEGFFESGWNGWIDGGSDSYRYSGSRSFEGSYSIRLRDNSGAVSSMTSEVFDLSGFDTVEMEFYFYPYSMENGEDFFVRFNDGSGWNTIATYTSGNEFSNNGFYVATVTLDASIENLTNNSQFRFQCDASSNSDYIYIDEITITGFTNSSGARGNFKSVNRKSIAFINALDTSSEDILPEDFKIYPSPATSNLNVDFNNEKSLSYKITTLGGKALKKGNLKNKIDVSFLKTGIYILEITSNGSTIKKKFIKK